MPNVIGAAATTTTPGRRTNAKKGGKAGKSAKNAKTTVVVQAPPAETKPAKRRGKGKGRSSGMMSTLDVQGKGIALGAAYVGQKMLAAKSTAGIPNSVIAGIAVEYFGKGAAWARPAATGLVVLGGIEYILMSAIREGKFNDMIAPYLKAIIEEKGQGSANAQAIATALNVSVAGDGESTGYDRRMAGVADRFANGG